MAGQMIEFRANGGTANGYLAKPASGTGPGVIVVQEWWGLNDHVKSLADRLASEGFVALAPDLYHGDMTREPDEAGKLMMALDIEQAEKDLRGAAAALKANGATGAKVGAVGFCMGGQLALFAGTVSNDVGPVVDFYGIHPAVKPDYSKLSAPLLLICGDKDHMAGPDPSGNVVNAVKAAGKQAELVVYPGADHAFMNDTRPEVHKPQESADAWGKMVSHLRSNLQ
jgi:carboxymethylenebutenolidase